VETVLPVPPGGPKPPGARLPAHGQARIPRLPSQARALCLIVLKRSR